MVPILQPSDFEEAGSGRMSRLQAGAADSSRPNHSEQTFWNPHAGDRNWPPSSYSVKVAVPVHRLGSLKWTGAHWCTSPRSLFGDASWQVK